MLTVKNKKKNLFSVGFLKLESHLQKDEDPLASVRIQGSGFVSKCHGYGILVATVQFLYTINIFVQSFIKVYHCIVTFVLSFDKL